MSERDNRMQTGARRSVLLRRFERLLRFGAVGITVSLLNTAMTVYFLRAHLLTSSVAAISVATLITMPISFLAHRRVTYADTARRHYQWVLFFLLSLSSLIFGAGAMKAAEMMHASYWVGLALAWVAIPSANYLVNAFYIFRVRSLFGMDRSEMEDV